MGGALVIGVGQIGQAMAALLLERGWTVTVAHRGSSVTPMSLVAAGVRTVLFDRNDDAAFQAALTPGFDIAVDTVAYDAGHADQWNAARHRIGRLAVISTGSVYADASGRTLDEAVVAGFPHYPVPIPESQPRIAAGAATYSTRKAAMENTLLAAWDDGLTILRPFAVHGPGSRSPREWWFLARWLAGARVVRLPFDGESRFHTSAADNIAALACTALQSSGIHVLNAADPEALTVTEIGRAIASALEWEVEFVGYSGPPATPADGTPWSGPRAVVADLRAAQALGYSPVTDYRKSSHHTCQALLKAAEASGWRQAFPGLAVYPEGMFEP